MQSLGVLGLCPLVLYIRICKQFQTNHVGTLLCLLSEYIRQCVRMLKRTRVQCFDIIVVEITLKLSRLRFIPRS